MQQKGVTNPRQEIKDFTREFVAILLKKPIDEEVHLDNHSFYDSKGKLIATVPIEAENM